MSAAAARRRHYHVGNVRAQLLAAARDLLEEQGASALSLRAIAERAGVAPGTVYYHYADKHALLAGLAVDGFNELADAMRRAFEAEKAQGGLRATGLAYLAFLREKPALYELMFEELDIGRREDVIAAEQACRQVSADSILYDFGPYHSPETAREMCEAIWAWGRGIAAVSLPRAGSQSGPLGPEMESAVRGLTALISRR